MQRTARVARRRGRGHRVRHPLLLLEHPPAWSATTRDDAFAAALPGSQHALLQQLWAEQQLRPLLVRRPGRTGRRPVAEPVLLVGAAHRSQGWLEGLPAGRLHLPGLRGRTGSSAVAGTAEVAPRRRLGLVRLADVEVVAEHPHADLVASEDGPEPAGSDVVLRAGAATWRVVVRTADFAPSTSVCDGTETFRATVVTDLAPA